MESKQLLALSQARPSQLRLYLTLARLHKFPLGSNLVFWPTAWGLTMAAYRTRLSPYVFALMMLGFMVGSTILHSASCVLSDMCDRDFDRQVERTKTRPLASGEVSMRGATTFLLIQTAVYVAMLYQLNGVAFQIGLFGLFVLQATYPLMKRWTYWPQAWLGLAINWGILVAWAAVTGSVDWPLCLSSLLSATCWSIMYDTIYACQDRKDDILAGVKSTAVLFGNYVKPIISVFAVLFVVSLTYVGVANKQDNWYFLSVLCTSLHLIWQLTSVNVDDPTDCMEKFVTNGQVAGVGGIIWIGFFADYCSLLLK